jgi:predicted nucleic acid-binding protein
MDKVLLDTSAIFALLNADHKNAFSINQALIRRRVVLVLPNFLLAESHAILNKRLGPPAARAFLNAALQEYEIERATLEDEWTAHALLQQTSRSKDLSYFDAVAIAMAERLEISEAFSFDRHFKLAGLKLAGE